LTEAVYGKHLYQKMTIGSMYFYSLTEHLVKNLEPEKDQWDLVFTMYSTYFYKEKLAYIVNGVLTNTTRSQAYLIDSTSSFESITKQQVNLSEFKQFKT
jgi:hypothetical protein